MKALRLIVLLSVVACGQQSDHFVPTIPNGFPALEVPEDNLLTREKIELGRKLFYEKGLSLDSSVSCASCHIQQFAFTDTARVSVGFQGDTGFRNATSLANVAFQSAFFRDGGVKTLERAVHPPILGEFEMNMNLDEMLNRLKRDAVYKKMFADAFYRETDHKAIVDALASFQRTLISINSPYDKFMAGDENALSGAEKRGLLLFRSEELNCAKCHKEPLFMDNDMHNIGLYENYHEFGRGRVTLQKADFGKFRTPTLRNIRVTFPYMHDGSLKTLDEVIDFYKTGGQSHPNKSVLMKPFNLSEAEKADLIAFLNALTDIDFLENEAFSNPN